MSPSSRLAATGFALACLAGIGGLSRVPYSADAGTAAVLRLAWRSRSVRVQVCRHRTAEEMAALPAHMREDEVCERQLLPYRLRLEVDGAMAADQIVYAAGARQDRPLYVFHQSALQPGSHRVSLRFERQGIAPLEPPEQHAEEYGVSGASPAAMGLDTTVTVVAGEILLVTYEEDTRRLAIRRGS